MTRYWKGNCGSDIVESYDKFIERLASPSSAPGGGAASAMVSIVASSLNQMVASLTLNKKKYAEFQDEMNSVIEKSRKLDIDLRKLMKEDEDAFNEIISALRLPKDTDEEKESRKKSMIKATKGAIKVPWKIASASRDVLELSRVLAEHGNKNAVTDAGCSALFAYSAIEGVLYNVRINLNSLTDDEFVREEKTKINLFLKDCSELKAAILEMVDKKIGDE